MSIRLQKICYQWIATGLLCAYALTGFATPAKVLVDLPLKKVILETDITFDVDDVGALATLHALADNGQFEILAVMYNEVHADGISAIHAINEWYQREDLPIGAFRGSLKDPDSSGYLTDVAKLSSTPPPVQDALELYRQILTKHDDRSITIISVGFLPNLDQLLTHEKELIQAKVSEIVVMGGRHRDQFNFIRHDLLNTTKRVLTNWPTPLKVIDFGHNVITGTDLGDKDPRNPIRQAFLSARGDDFPGRSSWDQVAVLSVAQEAEDWFETSSEGEIIFIDGEKIKLKPNWRSVVDPTVSREFLETTIELFMNQPPLDFNED